MLCLFITSLPPLTGPLKYIIYDRYAHTTMDVGFFFFFWVHWFMIKSYGSHQKKEKKMMIVGFWIIVRWIGIESINVGKQEWLRFV